MWYRLGLSAGSGVFAFDDIPVACGLLVMRRNAQKEIWFLWLRGRSPRASDRPASGW